MSRPVRVRFAPSPTGPLHVGGVRTALYNYLFAKKHGGDFILRIEDTDQARFVPGAEAYIIESLRWCGITPNEGVGFGNGAHAPYRQSERKNIYQEYALRLVNEGKAYYAFDTEEHLMAFRLEKESAGSAFSYNAATRMNLRNSLTLSTEETSRLLHSNEHFVIRLKVPADEEISLTDIIRGQVSVHTSQMDDKVLFKSDGMPTYHLANVVDDYLMKITHVIRGEEWLPSAPLHVLLYRSFGWENVMPEFAHLPLLLKPDGNGKLSKRDGDRLGFPVFPINWADPISQEIFSGYREKGYDPHAFTNMLALLGWHPSGDQEIFSMEELIRDFSLERVSKSGARFDPEKTKWFNEQYLRHKPDAELAAHLKKMLKKEFGYADSDIRMQDHFLIHAVQLLKERVQFDHEMIEKGIYLFKSPEAYDESVIAKKMKPGVPDFFRKLIEAFQSITEFSAGNTEQVFKQTAEQNNFKPGDVLQLYRVFLSGQAGGVNLFGMTELLGKKDVCNRLEQAISLLKVT